MNKPIQFIGVGSPIVDLIAEVNDDVLLSISGKKGGMELVDSQEMKSILDLLYDEPVKETGGSAGNTTYALTRMGMTCAFLGKLGYDNNGLFYRDSFERRGVDCSRFKIDKEMPTASCISLVTPDAERTMRTNLGAASTLSPEDITVNDFLDCKHAHVEGYLLFNRDLLFAVLNAAQEAGCSISLDLGSFEVVESARDILPGILERYVDIVFANEEEASIFCGEPDPETCLKALGALCKVAAVKMGMKGALLMNAEETARVSAVPAEIVLDTTGAGDYWAAGFLYGYLNGYDLTACGRIGSLLGGQIVQYFGANLPKQMLESMLGEIQKMK